MTEEKHWRSRAHYIKALGFDELVARVNEFCKDKFVVAWQIFTDAKFERLHCIVTYKEKE